MNIYQQINKAVEDVHLARGHLEVRKVYRTISLILFLMAVVITHVTGAAQQDTGMVPAVAVVLMLVVIVCHIRVIRQNTRVREAEEKQNALSERMP